VEVRSASAKTRNSRHEIELGRLNRQVQELIGMRTDGLVTDQEFLMQKSLLSERRIALESAPIPERINHAEVRTQLGDITEPLSQLRETWETLPDAIRRRFDRLILPVGFVNGESRTAELGLLFRTLGDLAHEKSNVVPLTGELSNRIVEEIRAFAAVLSRSEDEEMAA
ncbi:MAG: hypothetical protein WA734_08935, partial [Candidatus Acidiferrales bacterium]